jgi:hypothetical protein
VHSTFSVNKKWSLKMKAILVLVFVVFPALSAWATGHDQGGGGDLCEDRIKIIRDDFRQWIAKGGANALQLPLPLTVDQYSSSMLGQMAITKIRCVSNGDAGYPVEVNGTAKTCRFDFYGGQSLITCDFSKFQSIDESSQYSLIHHEYAGLAGIEVPNGDDSLYSVSNQISGFLEDQIVKKLVVKPPPISDEQGPFDPQSCQGPALTYQKGLSYIQPGETSHDFNLTAFGVWERSRDCNTVTGCKPWTPVDMAKVSYSESNDDMSASQTIVDTIRISLNALQKNINYSIQFCPRTSGGSCARTDIKESFFFTFDNADIIQSHKNLSLNYMWWWGSTPYTGIAVIKTPLESVGSAPLKLENMDGIFTDHCFRFAKRSSFQSGNGSYTELDIVYMGQY